MDEEPAWAIVEELEVDVEPEVQAAYLRRDREVWTAYLATRPGFLGKQVWRPVERPGVLVLQIWWRTQRDWDAVPAADVARLDREMGPLLRPLRCRAHHALDRTA
jgi:uncharacterized protein (TIGR03792 family)